MLSTEAKVENGGWRGWEMVMRTTATRTRTSAELLDLHT